jgi:hypothetical protein
MKNFEQKTFSKFWNSALMTEMAIHVIIPAEQLAFALQTWNASEGKISGNQAFDGIIGRQFCQSIIHFFSRAFNHC